MSEEHRLMPSLMQEFLQVWPTIALVNFLRYAIAASVLALLLFALRHRVAHRRIQARRARRADIRREFSYSMLTIAIFAVVGTSVFLGAQYGVFRLDQQHLPTLSAGLFDLAVMIVAHDAYFYWIHRAMHHPRLYRHFHRLHHRSITPTPWAAYSFAPLEAIVEAAFLPLILLIFSTSTIVAIGFSTHMILRNVIGHAGIEIFPRRWMQWPILRAMTTTTHHDLHHSAFRWNYGLYFTWWDRLMGTEHPRYQETFAEVTTRPGIAAHTVPESGLEPLS